MLSRLRIRNLAIIDDLILLPGRGLNLLTGETGAGKSIIVEALGLVTGGRGGADTVRAGEAAAIIEAVFDDVPETVGAWAERMGAAVEDRSLILRREAGADGRSRAWAGGAAVPLSALREAGELLVDLHGQHQAVTLLKSSTHLDALDRFAGLQPLREPVRRACEDLGRARAALEELLSGLGSRAERLDRLRFEERELAEASPRTGEETELRAERSRLAHAGRIASAAGAIVEALAEEDGAALERVGRARAAAAELAHLDSSIASLVERLDEARFVLEDAASAGRDLQAVEADPARLEWIESRLAKLESLGRRHGGLDTLPETLARVREEIALLEGGEASAEKARRRVEDAAERYRDAAVALSAARGRAAGPMAAALERELAALAFGRVRVEVALAPRRDESSPVRLDDEPIAVTAAGFDAGEILFSSNAGEPAKPLSRVASGGELARVLLALNVLLGEAKGGSDGWAPTVVFDEVDAGVGGRTADAVGERLARIAAARQVFCVTHLPQVACRATTHWRIGKAVAAGRTVVHADPLEPEARVEEIARMIAGRTVSEAARRHARELLAEASAATPSARARNRPARRSDAPASSRRFGREAT